MPDHFKPSKPCPVDNTGVLQPLHKAERYLILIKPSHLEKVAFPIVLNSVPTMIGSILMIICILCSCW